MPSRSALRFEDGFTLVELLAACLLLLVGILGVVSSLDHSRDAISTAEARETAAHRAQRELERVRALPYASIGLTRAPSPRPRWDGASAANAEALVTGGAVEPTRTYDDGRMTGTLEVLVTAYDDPKVPGAVDAKRVVVAVAPAGAHRLRHPVVASTVVPAPLP